MTSCKERKKQGKALPLACFRAGQQGVIVYIQPGRGADFHRLRAFGLSPGTPVLIERTFPVIILRLPYANLFLDDELAAGILIHPTESQKSLIRGCKQKKKFGRSSFYSRLKQKICHK